MYEIILNGYFYVVRLQIASFYKMLLRKRNNTHVIYSSELMDVGKYIRKCLISNQHL